MDGGAWWAAVHGVARSWIRLSDFTLFFPMFFDPPFNFFFLASYICLLLFWGLNKGFVFLNLTESFFNFNGEKRLVNEIAFYMQQTITKLSGIKQPSFICPIILLSI